MKTSEQKEDHQKTIAAKPCDIEFQAAHQLTDVD